MEIIESNIAKLNIYFKEYPIKFIFDGSVIQVTETIPYFFASNSAIKDHLKFKYGMIFGNGKMWYIDGEGLKYLSEKNIKLAPAESIVDMKKRVLSYIKQIQQKELQEGIENVLKALPEFYESSASLRKHHCYKYGLIEHSLQVLEYSLAIVRNYENPSAVNIDLIIAGAILHDIGKVHSYEQKDLIYSPTDIMITQDHIVHGIALLERYLKSNSEPISEEIKNALIHIIASHHTLKEWGSPIEPKTIEAWIIAIQDNLSAKIGG